MNFSQNFQPRFARHEPLPNLRFVPTFWYHRAKNRLYHTEIFSEFGGERHRSMQKSLYFGHFTLFFAGKTPYIPLYFKEFAPINAPIFSFIGAGQPGNAIPLIVIGTVYRIVAVSQFSLIIPVL